MISILLIVWLGASGIQEESPAVETGEKEAMIVEIEGMLMSPCCYGGPINQHSSGVALEMKADVRKLVYLGTTKEEIYDKYVAKYSKRILAEPDAEGFNTLAYILPPLVVLVATRLGISSISR